MDKIVPNLDPNKKYKLRYRAVGSGGELGQWSPLYVLNAPVGVPDVSTKSPVVESAPGKYIIRLPQEVVSVVLPAINNNTVKIEFLWKFWTPGLNLPNGYEVNYNTSGAIADIAHIVDLDGLDKRIARAAYKVVKV
jgi:hypothetical protein